jgi:ABC-type methionine transport system permease subunit
MEEKIVTRRDFIRLAGGTAMAGVLGTGMLGEAHAEPMARVVLIRNAEVLI